MIYGVQESHHGLGFFLGGGVGLDLSSLGIPDAVEVAEGEFSDRIGHFFIDESIIYLVYIFA